MDIQCDPESRARAIRLTAIIAPCFTGVFVLLRLYTRIWVTKSVALNDWVALITLPLIIAFSATLVQDTYWCMGSHESFFEAHPYYMNRYLYWILINSEFYLSSLLGYKTSILLLYHSIFVHRTFRLWCYGVLFIVWGYLISNLITEVFGCSPIAKFWDSSLEGHCINSRNAEIAYGAFNMGTDLVIAILPIPMIWRLHMRTTRDKIGLAIVLGGGFIAFAVAAVRYGLATSDLTSADRTYRAGLTFLWSVLEVNTGLIASCTPALKPFLRVAKEKTSAAASALSSRRFSRSANRTFDEDDNEMSTGLALKKTVTANSRRPSWWPATPWRRQSEATAMVSPGGTSRKQSVWTVRKPSQVPMGATDPVPAAVMGNTTAAGDGTTRTSEPTRQQDGAISSKEQNRWNGENEESAGTETVRDSQHYTYENMLRQV